MKKKPFEPNETVIAHVERMAKIGLTTDQIGTILGRGKKTIFRDFDKFPELREAYERGAKHGVDEVSQTAYAMATSGKFPAMTMFWLKCRAQWREVTHIEHTGKVTLEEIIVAASKEKPKAKPDNDESA
jgi:hypothetical protein